MIEIAISHLKIGTKSKSHQVTVALSNQIR